MVPKSECATLYSCFGLVDHHQQHVAQTAPLGFVGPDATKYSCGVRTIHHQLPSANLHPNSPAADGQAQCIIIQYIVIESSNTVQLTEYTLELQIYTAGGDYKEGDIRLVGGSYSWEARVEIYLYGEWGTISYPYTNREDAHVVCQQLGYDTRCEML